MLLFNNNNNNRTDGRIVTDDDWRRQIVSRCRCSAAEGSFAEVSPCPSEGHIETERPMMAVTESSQVKFILSIAE